MAQEQYPTNEFTAEDNPYTVQPSVTDNRKSLRVLDDAAKKVSTGQPIDESTMYDTTPIETSDDNQVKEAQKNRQEAWGGVLEGLAKEKRADLLPKAVSTMQEDYQQSTEAAKKAIAPFFARVYNTPGAENLTDQQVTDIAIDDYTLDAMAGALDKQGGWDTAGDIINMMVLPDYSYNAAKISDGNWFTSVDGMEHLAERRHALTPTERLKFDGAIRKQLSNIESSKVENYLTMLDVMGSNPNLTADHWLDKSGVLDLAGIGTGLVKGLRSLNKMRQLSKIGDELGVATAAEVASKNPSTSKIIGVPMADAVTAGNPIKDGLKDTVLNGTSLGNSVGVRARTDKLQSTLNNITNIIGPQMSMTTKERSDLASRWAKEIGGKSDVSDVQVTWPSPDTARIRYVSGDQQHEMFRTYGLDDFGGFTEKELPLRKVSSRYIWSPMMLHKGDRSELSSAGVYGMFQKAKASALYDKAARYALKPIKNSKESLDRVNTLLNKLNGEDIDVGRHSLTKVGIGGTKLTDKEYDAFSGIRKIFDHMWAMNNATIREDYQFAGLKHVPIGDDSFYVKPYLTSGDASKGYHMDVANNQVLKVMDDGSMQSIDRLSPQELDTAYKEGQVLVKANGKDQYGWFRDGNNNHSRYALVSKDSVGELPDRVLGYTPNYVPRQREDANFFIRSKDDMLVNGNKVEGSRAVAWANTRAQAELYRDKLASSLGRDAESFEVVPDTSLARGAGSSSADETAVRMNGGLYRGPRSSTKLEYAGDATDGKIVDALDTLQRAMRYTSDRMTMSKLRQVLRHRWYQDAIDVDPNVNELGWSEARGAIKDSSAPIQVKSKLMSSHDHISTLSMIPTRDEQAFQGFLRAVADKLDYGKADAKKIGKFFYPVSQGVAKRLYSASRRGTPVDKLKGATFHIMLGGFSPAQYLVQMMGATAAMSANPLMFTKAIPSIFGATFTDLLESADVADVIKYLTRKGVMPKGYEKDINFWRKSGMYEAVLRNNADYDNAGKFMPLSAGMMRRGLSHLANASTMFYEGGELASSRISFFTALEHTKSALGKSFKYSEDDLQKVVARAEQYRLGMSSANKAQFQKGWASLPTQFKSIYTKFLESMMGDWFSKRERASIFAGQVALFGAAGVPFINYWKDNIVQMLVPEDATPNELKAYEEGAVGWLISGYWDIDASVSSRVALAGDLITELQNSFTEEQPFYQSFMGPSFITGSRIIDAASNAYMAGHMLWEDEDLDNYSRLSNFAQVLKNNLERIPTSSRRMMEAYVLDSFHEVRTASGRTLYKKMADDVKARDVIARAMGFSSDELQDIYETNQSIYARKDRVQNIANFYLGVINDLTMSVDNQDEDSTKAIQMVLSAVNKRFNSDKDRRDIINSIRSGLENKDFSNGTIKKWLENYTSELLDARGKVFIKGEEEAQK